MPITLEQKLRQVRLRSAAKVSLDILAQVLTSGGIVALLAVLLERLAALSIIHPWTVYPALAAALAVTLVFAWVKAPTRMQTAVILDDKLHLKERFSTAISLGASKEPFAIAACQEAHKTAASVNPAKHFPLQLSREWVFACAAWVLVIGAFWGVPEKDIFGFLHRKEAEKARQAQAKQAETLLKEATTPVEAAVKQLADSRLDASLAALGDIPAGQPPKMAKQEAIRKLGDLADKLKEIQADPEKASLSEMQEMLKQLKGSQNELARNLQLALAKGEFGKASQELRNLQKLLNDGTLSPEQKERALAGLKQIAQNLEQIAQNNEAMENELQKAGIDKKLARLSPEQLKKALQEKGLDPKKVGELVQKAAACKAASGRCSGLGKAMAAAAGSGGAGEELQMLADELDKLDNFKQQAKLSDAVLAQIDAASKCLGQGMCQGPGMNSPWSAGSSDKIGKGTGGPGKGYGETPSDKEGDTKTAKTRVDNSSKSGPVIASWYNKDEQIKGEPLRSFSEVVQAGRDSAAEAISENRIPRKYEESIKEYFGAIEKNGAGGVKN